MIMLVLIICNALLFLFLPLASRELVFTQPKPIIMIAPAGHAQHLGRKIHDTYERAETLKFAEKLKEKIEHSYNVNVVLSRAFGEEILPLQSASFANRLKVKFFLSLHLYQEESLKPKIFLYHLVYNPLIDFNHPQKKFPTFVPLHQAHFKSIQTTKILGNYIKDSFQNHNYKKQFDLYGPYGLPCKPLVGISAPALAFEIGIHKINQWESLIDPVVTMLDSIIKNI